MLVSHYAQRVTLGRQPENGFQEIIAMDAEQPARSKNQVTMTCCGYRVLAGEFASTVCGQRVR